MNADTLLATLTGLGDTPDEVAAHLRAAGIRGRRHNPERCPVAMFLQWAGYADPYVDENGVGAVDEGDRQVWVNTPKPVADFIVQFDDGAYPDLVLADP